MLIRRLPHHFAAYIGNHCEFIPNFGGRPRQVAAIRTAFLESTVNRPPFSRRSSRCRVRSVGPAFCLQTRTEIFNEELDAGFRRWHPNLRPQPQTQAPDGKAAA